MSILEVSGLKKIYTTRLGGSRVGGPEKCKFQRGKRRVCGDNGRIGLGQNYSS